MKYWIVTTQWLLNSYYSTNTLLNSHLSLQQEKWQINLLDSPTTIYFKHSVHQAKYSRTTTQSPYSAGENFPKSCFPNLHSVCWAAVRSLALLIWVCVSVQVPLKSSWRYFKVSLTTAREAQSAADAYPCCMLPQIAAFVFYTVRVFYSLEELDFLNNILPFL